MKKTKVLIVEDEIIVAEHLQLLLKQLGYAVPDYEANGEIAIKRAAELQPDLVLMDIKLQGALNGIQAADRIQEQLDIPVVYLTAFADEDTLQRAKVTEPFGYLVKPVGESELIAVIETALYKHRAEKALRDSEQRLLKAESVAHLGHYEIDLATGTAKWSDETFRIFGINPDRGEPTVESYRQLVHDEDQSKVFELFDECIREDKTFDLIYRIVNADGEVRHVHSIGELIKDPEDQPAGMFGTLQDITERKQAEQALKAQTHLSQVFMESFPCVALLLKKNSREIVASNKEAVAFGAVPGKTCYGTWAQSEHPCPWCLAPKLWKTGEPQHLVVEALDIIWDAYWQPVDEDIYLHYAFDITEQVRAEKELQQYSQRLETLHRLDQSILEIETAGSIAQATLEHIGELIPFQRASVTLFNYEDDEAVILAAHSPNETELGRGTPLPLNKFPLEQLQSGKVHVMADITAASELNPTERKLLAEGVRSSIAVPLIVKHELIGSLNLGAETPGRFGDEQIEIAREIANSLAVAVEQANLLAQVRRGRERLQKLSKQLLRTHESERRYVALELHDQIGQSLTAVKISLQAAQRLEIPAALVQHLDQSIGSIDNALQHVRDLAIDLRPAMLDDLGLEAALRWYIDKQAQAAGFKAEFVAGTILPRPDPEIETVCYRVAQEALTNIMRHAQAQTVRVELGQDDDSLWLFIQDDGVGFDVVDSHERAARGESLGLLSMHERVELTGGQLRIDSVQEQGTSLKARFPLSLSQPIERRKAWRKA